MDAEVDSLGGVAVMGMRRDFVSSIVARLHLAAGAASFAGTPAEGDFA
jgi:hypothetical protein